MKSFMGQRLKGVHIKDGRAEQALYEVDQLPNIRLPEAEVPLQFSFCVRRLKHFPVRLGAEACKRGLSTGGAFTVPPEEFT